MEKDDPVFVVATHLPVRYRQGADPCGQLVRRAVQLSPGIDCAELQGNRVALSRPIGSPECFDGQHSVSLPHLRSF